MNNHSGHRCVRGRNEARAGVAFFLLAVFLFAAAGLLDRWGDARYTRPVSTDAAPAGPAPQQPKTILYQGMTYVQRPQLKTYLLLGIDVEGPATGSRSDTGGGQADVQVVLVVDHANRTWQTLQINRDTLTEVQVLDVNGAVVSTGVQQIALAHACGDGLKRSCRNAVDAVSNLLAEQPIDGYMALNRDAVVILNDLVGGVPVTVTSDFLAVDGTLTVGETVTLQGEQALTFMRSRRDEDGQAGLSRMARQRQYLTALQKQLAGQDEEFSIRAYNAVADYMVTNIGSGTAAKIGEYLNRYAGQPMLTIDGTAITDAAGNAAYQPDEDSRMQTILKLFYQRQ